MPLNRYMKELLLQTLEHERGTELVYDAAIECAVNQDLEDEWEDYLEETERHVEVLTEACEALGIDPDEMTRARQIAQHHTNALVVAVKMAGAEDDPLAAELAACESVMAAENRNRFNWELIGECVKALTGEEQAVLADAFDEIAYDEDDELYETRSWCRDLWLGALGVDADVPASDDASVAPNAEERVAANDDHEEVLK
jgi:hypothetical protein